VQRVRCTYNMCIYYIMNVKYDLRRRNVQKWIYFMNFINRIKKKDFLKSTQGIYINIVYITLARYVILCVLYNIIQYPISSELNRVFVLVYVTQKMLLI
jgi:hypothetical protein